MTEGVFPKSDGDVLYASEVNNFNSGIVPIGSVISWLKSLTNCPALPSGFVECNGQVLSDADSVFNGVTLPNLNGNLNVLYGKSTSGTTRTEDFLPVHNHTVNTNGDNYGGIDCANPTATRTDIVINTPATGTAWTGYSVVYIMRVK